MDGSENEEKEIEKNDRRYHFSEISYGSFTRTYNLPRTVNSKDIKADYREGTIQIPKSE